MILLAIDIWMILEKVVLIAVIIGLSFFIAMYTTYAERKVAAWLQDRRGPNRAGSHQVFSYQHNALARSLTADLY